MQPVVGIVMGSDSDLPVMRQAAEICERFGVAHEIRIVSAHRTPDDMAEYGRTAHERGLRVIIAGAGGAAHLPGMLASHTPLPVIGVPIASGALNGLDALLSIAQMPPGVPVACVAVNGAVNAAVLAAEIIGVSDGAVAARLAQFKADLARKVTEKDAALRRQS